MSIPRMDSLIDWARSHGAHFHEQVEVYDDPQQGISLRVRSSQQSGHFASQSNQAQPSRQHLSPKSRIVSCPFGLSLSFLNALNKFPELQSHSTRFPAFFLEVLEPHVIGHFFLIQQYFNVDTSHWGPYIKSLPQPEEFEKLGTPLYFTEEDVNWIRGTDLEVARDLRQETWKSDWERGRRILDTSSGWEKWQGKWTWDLYKWAATIFSSRSFVSTLIPEEVLTMPVIHGTRFFHGIFPVLFPLLDLANHSSTAKVTWFTNARNEPKDLSIISESEISEGQQVFNNYAPKNNTELMLGYGFCLPGNDEVGIAFKPLGEELVAIRKQHLNGQSSHGGDPDQNLFHVRASSYSRPTDEQRLSEFRLVEDGGVDALAVLAANRREMEYMTLHPNDCPERSSEAVFLGPLSRNILSVLSLLLERLTAALEKITCAGEHLGTPETSCQRAAKIYRDGQVSVLQSVTKLIELRFDVAFSKHTICGHLHEDRVDDSKFIEMCSSVELITLQCAFSWLQINYSTIYNHTIAVIAKELDVSTNPELDWIELLDAGWDYTLWCLWIYVVLLLRSSDETRGSTLGQVRYWIEEMLRIYSSNEEFSGWPSQSFHGDKDEDETLCLMINQVRTQIHQGKSTNDDTNRKQINFTSTIAMEETFTANVEIETTRGKMRVHQRVLFIAKFPNGNTSVN